MKNTIETFVQILFIVLFGILVILVSLGIEQDFTRVKTTEFWVEVSAQLALTMIIFNIVHALDKNNRLHDEGSRFFSAYATNRLRIKEIEDQKLYDKLDVAVEEKNKETLIIKCNNKLHKLCSRVNYNDVISDEPIEYVIKKFRVLKKKQKKFKKLVEKIRAGRIKVKTLNAEIFLHDKELLFEKREVYDYNSFMSELKRNTEKAITFLVCSVITATITFSFHSPNFWTALATNFTLFLGAAISGIFSSIKDVKRKTALYEKRNTFLHKYLDLKVEYKKDNA